MSSSEKHPAEEGDVLQLIKSDSPPSMEEVGDVEVFHDALEEFGGGEIVDLAELDKQAQEE